MAKSPNKEKTAAVATNKPAQPPCLVLFVIDLESRRIEIAGTALAGRGYIHAASSV
jgi:hypothetical protein